MSIILDALKKADKKEESQSTEKTSDGSGASEENSVGMFNPKPSNGKSSKSSKKKSNKRVFVLVGVFLIGAVYAAYTLSGLKLNDIKIYKPKVPTQVAAQKEVNVKENKVEQSEIDKRKALKFFHDGKYEKSIKIFQDLLEKETSDPGLYNNFGVALKKAGKINESREAYQTAIMLKPDYYQALNNLAVIELFERNYNEAKRNLLKALEFSPEYVDAHLHLAVCLERLGELEKAMTYYRSFLSLSEGKYSRKVRIQIESRLARLTEDVE